MAVKFFGQFLIEQGEIDAGSLRAALDLMERENPTLGELAVRAGFASESDCRRVNGEQRRLDRPFGELAQEMGVLNSIEVEELLQNQRDTRINVGDAMVRLGHLSRERLSDLEDAFKRDQAMVPQGAPALPDALVQNRMASCLVDMFPRYCMRMARIEVGLSDASVEYPRDPDMNLIASLVIMGAPGVEMHLLSDSSFARKLSAGIASLPESSITAELCLDGLGEFLNVLAGNAMSALEGQGSYRLEAPRYGRFPDHGWWFYASSDYGRAAVIMTPVEPRDQG